MCIHSAQERWKTSVLVLNQTIGRTIPRAAFVWATVIVAAAALRSAAGEDTLRLVVMAPDQAAIPLDAPRNEKPQANEKPQIAASKNEKLQPNEKSRTKEPTPKSSATAPQSSTSSAPARPRPPLTPAMIALRDRVRAAVAQHFQIPLNTSDNTPSQIIKFCLAFGCDSEIRYGSVAGGSMSGIGALCYNYPCAGYRLLIIDREMPLARVGYGFQETPGEFLAMLAQSSVPDSYEIRIGTWRGKVADLIEAEKRSCVAGSDLSQKLIGLTHYLPHDASWKNSRGDAWSFERMVREELNRTPSADSSDATNHLCGLAHALDRRVRAGQPLDGHYERAKKFLDEYQAFALSLQNADGSWNPAFFAARGSGRDVWGSLRSTGRILGWLCVSLPPERLEDAQIVRAVTFLTTILESDFSHANIVYAAPREIDGLMHALHALKVYEQRVFNRPEPPKNENPNTPKPPETQA